MRESSRTKASSKTAAAAGIGRKVLVLCILALWAFVAASLIGFDKADPPSHLVYPPNESIANWCGAFGATLSYTLLKMLGAGAWVLTIVFGIGIIAAACGHPPKHALLRMTGAVLLAMCISGLQNLLFPASGAFPDLSGGLVGLVAKHELAARIGGIGAFIALSAGAVIGALVCMDEWVTWAFGWAMGFGRERVVPAAATGVAAAGEVALAAGSQAARAAGDAGSSLWAKIRAAVGLKKRRPRVRVNDVDDEQLAIEQAAAAKRAAEKQGKKTRKTEEPAAELDETEAAQLEAASAAGIEDDEEESVVEVKPGKARGGKAAQSDEQEEEEEDLPGAPQVYDEGALREKIAKLPVFFGTKDKQVATEADLASMQNNGAPETDADGMKAGKVYQFPGLDLLENPEENFNVKLEEYVREQAAALEGALRQYRIDGEVVGIESGPVITLYDVRLAPGTKVAQIEAISKDVARALKAINIRIVPNQAGRDTIAIEVPNATKEKVRLKELMGKTEVFSGMKLPMFLGKDASGVPLIEDLTKMPHMLIAGTTGSGKSVCMNTIIMGFLYTKKPSELKLVLVDPKMVEMSQFKDIPHLMCPVVTEMSKAAAILEWACNKMDERYELLAEAGCRDIASYNELPWDELKDRLGAKTPEEEAKIPRKLPYMVFIIDELADLMMTAKEVESHIIRIAQKARAVGIHLILATQRPQANVVTGLIKSNMPSRICFKVASGMDSRIVLDQKGGELLLGHGDMLYLSPRSSKLSRAQGTLVDDLEIRRVVRFMRDVAAPPSSASSSPSASPRTAPASPASPTRSGPCRARTTLPLRSPPRRKTHSSRARSRSCSRRGAAACRSCSAGWPSATPAPAA